MRSSSSCSVKLEKIVKKHKIVFALTHNYSAYPMLREVKSIIEKEKIGKVMLINMTKSERFGASLFEYIYRISPRLMGGCRGLQLTELLTQHGFHIEVREYIQQMLFPSEVIIAYK